jgi:hypothetical protein
LKKKIEQYQKNEKSSFTNIEKLVKECDRLKHKNESLENLIQSYEKDLKERDNRLVNQNVKIAKLENQLEQVKEKSVSQLAKMIEKSNKKEELYLKLKLDTEKKITHLLKLLELRQENIDNELSAAFNLDLDERKIHFENKKLKEVLVEVKSN